MPTTSRWSADPSLSGVTEAVVGVVFNLALVLGAAVIFRKPVAGTGSQSRRALAAFVALYKFRAGVLWVVLADGLIGLGRTMLLV